MTFNHLSKNGEVRPIGDAVVSVENIEYAYGFGVYEAIRVSNGIVYFIDDHIERLIESARIISLEHPFTPEIVKKAIFDLVEKTEERTFNLKILLIGASKKEEANMYILCFNPLFPDKKLYRDGVSLDVAHYERVFPHAKTLNMLQSYLAFRGARAKGLYDAILINRDDYITEGTRTNFYTIKEKTIFTPREEQILLGVTRKAVLFVAKKNGFTVQEKDIRLEDLPEYDGAFITSTSSKILPVKRAGGFEYKEIPSEILTLMKAFGDFLEKNSGVLPKE